MSKLHLIFIYQISRLIEPISMTNKKHEIPFAQCFIEKSWEKAKFGVSVAYFSYIHSSLSLSLSLSLSFFATLNCFDQIRFWIILVCPKFNFVKCSHGFCNGWSRERRIFDYFFLEEDKQKCIQSQNFFVNRKFDP